MAFLTLVHIDENRCCAMIEVHIVCNKFLNRNRTSVRLSYSDPNKSYPVFPSVRGICLNHFQSKETYLAGPVVQEPGTSEAVLSRGSAWC